MKMKHSALRTQKKQQKSVRMCFFRFLNEIKKAIDIIQIGSLLEKYLLKIYQNINTINESYFFY